METIEKLNQKVDRKTRFWILSLLIADENFAKKHIQVVIAIGLKRIINLNLDENNSICF